MCAVNFIGSCRIVFHGAIRRRVGVEMSISCKSILLGAALLCARVGSVRYSPSLVAQRVGRRDRPGHAVAARTLEQVLRGKAILRRPRNAAAGSRSAGAAADGDHGEVVAPGFLYVYTAPRRRAAAVVSRWLHRPTLSGPIAARWMPKRKPCSTRRKSGEMNRFWSGWPISISLPVGATMPSLLLGDAVLRVVTPWRRGGRG